MTKSNNSIKMRKLREQLLRNDFKPLPASAKGVHIKGWSRADIDQDFLTKHARRATHHNTGLRCDDLIAIDIDCLDAALADELEALTEQTLGETDWCRIGRAPKRLLLYRLEGEVGRSARTGKYGGQMVELLCGPGRQFIAYGLHPGTGEPYYWEGEAEPATHALSALPAVSYAAASALIDAIEARLAASGLALERRAQRQGLGSEAEYDLTDDFEFLTNDGELLSWGTLKADLTAEGIYGNIRRENGEFGDSDAVHAYIAKGSGQPCIYDFVRDTTHFESLGGEALAAALPPAPSAAVDVFTDDKLAELLRDWVLLGDKKMRQIDHPERSYKVEDMATFYSEYTIPSATGKGAPTLVVNAWKRHPERKKAHYAELRPDHADTLLIHQGNEIIFNTYRRPQHRETNGSIEVFMEFMRHLLPHENEAELLLDWCAYKVKHPDARMHGVVMVANNAYGTGRGVLFQIIQRLLGREYAREVDLKHLLGQGSQGQFNEYLSGSLVLHVSEALEEREEISHYKARHIAYEQLKKVCSPVTETLKVNRKYGQNTFERIFASILISTNHADALAIPHGDRRLLVLENTQIPLVDAPANLYDRLIAWLEVPANIGALYQYLLKRAERATYMPFSMPPMTPAKERMIEAGQSNVDQLFDMFVDQAAGDVCIQFQWRDFALKASKEYEMPLPEGEMRDKVLDAVWQNRTVKAPALPKSGLKIDKKVKLPRIIRNVKYWREIAVEGATPEAVMYRALLRKEIKKVGPIGGDIISLM